MAIALSNAPAGTNWRTDGGGVNINPLNMAGSATTTGHFHLLATAYNSASGSVVSITDSAGGGSWTFVGRNVQAGTATAHEFWRVSPTSAVSLTTIAITYNTTLRCTGFLTTWSGVDTSATLDTTTTPSNPSKSQGASVTQVTPGITTLDAGSLCVSITNNSSTATAPTVTWSGSTSLTAVGAQSGRVLTLAYYVAASAGAQSITWTMSPAGGFAGMTVAFKEAAGAPPPPSGGRMMSLLGVG